MGGGGGSVGGGEVESVGGGGGECGRAAVHLSHLYLRTSSP